jgi:hypothetical protein
VTLSTARLHRGRPRDPERGHELREREDHAELQRAAIARIESELGKVPVLPSVEELRAFLSELPAVVADRPDRARQVLGRLLVGPVKCFPPAERGGDYRLRFDLDPGALLGAETTKPASIETGSARGGCGGRI